VNDTPSHLRLRVGVKTDPIDYRYSYEWLFRLLATEGVRYLQLGSFVELYHLPDDFFTSLRQHAGAHGITIASVFTAHRELGGFFRDEHPAWQMVARRNYERLIEVGALLGASHVGSNPGAVVRDRMQYKKAGILRYVGHMKELMAYAAAHGVACLTIEPMSCSAEPPSTPAEIRDIADELTAFHRSRPASTATVGYCADVAHGYLDHEGRLQWDNYALLDATLPYLHELHLKNTDARFEASFGFSEEDRRHGIVDIESIQRLLLDHAALIPQRQVIGYLEIPGPKLGRDYSDGRLEGQLKDSLRYLKQAFETEAEPASTSA
jgi:sugar phosphate isomerase/epimerase